MLSFFWRVHFQASRSGSQGYHRRLEKPWSFDYHQARSMNKPVYATPGNPPPRSLAKMM
jgi:hypothetical protein